LGVDLSDINVDLGGSLGSVGPVSVAGIPSSFTISVQSLPKVSLGIDPITINKVQLGIDPLTVNPVELHMSVDRIPDIRAHLPADFHVGLSLLGMELMCVRLCGEAQMITEPYVPNPCERCGEPRDRTDDG
jgi:hypothetical protein